MFQNPLKLKLNKTRPSLFLVFAVILRLSIAQSVFYIQDSSVKYNPGTASLYQLTSLSPGWVSSTKYAVGLWLNKISWSHTPSGWDMIAAIAQNFNLRTLIMQLHPTVQSSFKVSTPNNEDGGPTAESLFGTSLAPIGTWVFFATGVDSVAQMCYGFRYYLSSESSTFQYFATGSDSYYVLNYPTTALYVGGAADPNNPYYSYFGNAYGTMQYVRLFLDYTPTTADEFLNIALMDSASNLYFFYFASDIGTSNNQTFIVSSESSSSQTNDIGFKGFGSSKSTQDVSFGPYNILMCRPGQIASFPLNAAIITKGLIVALDFYPYSSAQTTQTIFSIRDTGTNVISLRFDYFESSGTLDVWINPVSSTVSNTPYYVFSSSAVSVPAVTASSWNRVIVEIIQTQPLETGIGFSSSRIWVNSAVTSRAYFGNFATGDTAIADGNNAALDVCGAYDSASANLVSTTLTGDFDILNLLWITGSEGVFQNSSDTSCMWRVFIAPSQTTCLMCASGYFMQDDQKCVSSSPGSSYFLHSPTNSYQRCYYGQYYNLSSGVCSECTDDGQFILAPQCVNCDPTCRKCTGTAATQCAACYAGGYLSTNSSGSYCIQACSSGYVPNHSSNQCVTSLVNISQAQSGTLMAAHLITTAALTGANAVSNGFSVNVLMCLVTTASLGSMQYLNLNHSNIASTIYSQTSSSIVPNWIAQFNTLQQDTLIFDWEIFQRDQISSLYLDNYGDTLTEIMIYLGIYLLALFLTLFSKTEKLKNSFAGKAYITAFSLLVSNIFGNLQGQILYSLLQVIRSDFALDTYSILSLVTGYLTLFIVASLLVFCFFKLKRIFHHKRQKRQKNKIVEVFKNSEGDAEHEYEWLKKKYEFLFGDFKKESAHQFYFVFWMMAFDIVYILLIFSIQSIPILQCLSIVILAFLFIRYSAKINPFKKETLLFWHLFNFSCVFAAAFMNLILAIIDTVNPNFSGVETQGWFVTSIMILNNGTNTLFSLGGLLFQIHLKLKNKLKDRHKKVTINNPTHELVPQDMNAKSHSPLKELQSSLADDLVIQKIADRDNKHSISQPIDSFQVIKISLEPI